LAFVHDWLVTWGGGEQVLEGAVEALGPAPIHTLIYRPEVFSASPIGQQRIIPSVLQRLPGASRNHRRYLPLMPMAVEQFDLRDSRVVFTSCHAVSHGVLLRADQLHVNYVHSPMRYAWHLYQQYLEESGLARGVRSWLARGLLHYLRVWDFQAAQRPDHVLANSHWTARNIWRSYRRQATVIYPPVDTDAYRPLAPRDDYYLTVSRLVPYKRIGLILEAFRDLGYPLKVIGDGPLLQTYRRVAPANAEILGWQPKDRLAELMGRARAFVYMAEEDFGITPVEAQAAGCPVIAYGRGGVGETVIDGKTGCLFHEPSVEALRAAVRRFEESPNAFHVEDLHRHAERFSRRRFAAEVSDFVEEAWKAFDRPSAGPR
jgi:glycosyltransferase involved in cell wall biosynthesis